MIWATGFCAQLQVWRLPNYMEKLLKVYFYVTHEEIPGLIYYRDDLIKSNHIQRTVLFCSLGKIDFYLLLK